MFAPLGQLRLPAGAKDVKELRPKKRGTLNTVSGRLGIDTSLKTPLLERTGEKKEPAKLFFPKPADRELRSSTLTNCKTCFFE